MGIITTVGSFTSLSTIYYNELIDSLLNSENPTAKINRSDLKKFPNFIIQAIKVHFVSPILRNYNSLFVGRYVKSEIEMLILTLINILFLINLINNKIKIS